MLLLRNGFGSLNTSPPTHVSIVKPDIPQETHKMTLGEVFASLAYWSALLQNAFNTDLMCLSDILTLRL